MVSSKIAIVRRAQVIFHIARTLHVLRVGGVTLKFGKQCGVGFAQYVGQHIQAPAMRHAEHDVAHAMPLPDTARISSIAGIRRFAALKAEALRCRCILPAGTSPSPSAAVRPLEDGRAFHLRSAFDEGKASSRRLQPGCARPGFWMCMNSAPKCAAIGLRAVRIQHFTQCCVIESPSPRPGESDGHGRPL